MMLRSRAIAPARGLSEKLVGFVAGITVAAALVAFAAGPAAAAAAAEEEPFDRLLDVEIGGGLALGIEDDTTIDDTFLVQMQFAFELNNKLDFEFGGGYIDGEDPDSAATDNEFDNWFLDAGFRWYPNSMPEDRVRFYLMLGFQWIDELKGKGSDSNGWYLGPGLRMRLGDNSGVTFKLPVWVSDQGQTDTLLLPSFNFFYQF